jgi:hypothetical protein
VHAALKDAFSEAWNCVTRLIRSRETGGGFQNNATSYAAVA